jgi:hypothetical protein
MSGDKEVEDGGEEDLDCDPKSGNGSANHSRKRCLATERRSCNYTSNEKRKGRIAKSNREKAGRSTANRAFPCALAQYGCGSTFIAKTEWKRHVNTRHIRLGIWRCDMCSPTCNDFDRKDLFTQHLKRKHRHHPLTTALSEQGEISDKAILHHLERCYIVLRTNPIRSECIFCTKVFEGDNSWDERMEHVAVHLEGDKRSNNVQPCESWREDLKLQKWLREEGLIKRKGQNWEIGNGYI